MATSRALLNRFSKRLSAPAISPILFRPSGRLQRLDGGIAPPLQRVDTDNRHGRR
jgi:hypothetical protein